MKSDREKQLEHSLLTALMRIERDGDASDQKWAASIRAFFGFPPKDAKT